MNERPAVVFGLLHAGLALTRGLGRRGVPVHGVVLHDNDFGIRSKYLRSRSVFSQGASPERDRQIIARLRRLAADTRLVLFPERDENVAWVLDHLDEVREFADVPLPADPDVTRSLRRKERLVEVAERAGVPTPATVLADCEATIAAAGLRPPFLLKPAEGQDFALTFGEKVVVADSVEEACTVWRRADEAGFDMLVQEYVPDSHEKVYSLLAYMSAASGEPLAAVVGRKVRQGPLRFGTSAFFEVDYEPRVIELGLRLLEEAGYRGFAHVEFAHDQRDDAFKLLEVNTRLPVWAGIAIHGDFDIASVAYDDLCGHPPLVCRLYRDDHAWAYLAKDVYVSTQMARRRELRVGEVVRNYLRRDKSRAVFAFDDPRPALASLRYLRSRV
jgi:predicted ATP-grasp superfamily ATP-dependent carboligase